MKVALVHDYLREYGGAERVVEELHNLFPEAPVYTAYLNLNGLGSHASRIKQWPIKTSWLQYLPFANKLISPLRVLAPQIFQSFDLSEYDVIISSCNIYFAKAVKTSKKQLHLSYIHTPPRYLYGYTTTFNYRKRFLTRLIGETINHLLRITDFKVSQNPDILIANSKNVKQRIKKFYRREDPEIIYPPVDTEKFKAAWTPGEGGYFLIVSRLVRGKGVEDIVRVCTQLKKPLKVVGGGPLLPELKKIAGNTIEFLGPLADSHLPGIYASAGALIVSSEDEDFGITPVEAMAAGTPVIAKKAGGFLETVVAGKTGEFFTTEDELVNIIKEFDPTKYNKEDLFKRADQFSKQAFRKKILELIENNYPKRV